MPKKPRQKLKLLYLRDYLLRNTDENHGVTVAEMSDYLESCGISAERKSLYDDIALLSDTGLDILSEKRDRAVYYKVVSREFEVSELKLLVDAVLGSRFITQKKSEELIGKLETLCSRYEGYALDRQLEVTGRIKSMNESIYYNVDKLHNAIRDNARVTFRYFDYNSAKEKVYRHDGKTYEVSPFALSWDDENYYLVAYDSEHEAIRHYRVDKMDALRESEKARIGKEAFDKVDMSSYSRKVFSMFGGEAVKVRLAFAEHLAGVIIDRFGKDIFISPSDKDGFFTFETEIVVSPQFFGWLFSFGDEARILTPQSVKDDFSKYLENVQKEYQ